MKLRFTPRARYVGPLRRADDHISVERALSERDTKRVLKLLANPPKPSPALLAAARRRIGRD